MPSRLSEALHALGTLAAVKRHGCGAYLWDAAQSSVGRATSSVGSAHSSVGRVKSSVGVARG